MAGRIIILAAGTWERSLTTTAPETLAVWTKASAKFKVEGEVFLCLTQSDTCDEKQDRTLHAFRFSVRIHTAPHYIDRGLKYTGLKIFWLREIVTASIL